MELYKNLNQLDYSKTNAVITIISENNIGNKLLISDGEKVYTNNKKFDWDNIIKLMPIDNKNKTIYFNEEKAYIDFIGQNINVVVCGAGHISISIIKICKLLNYHCIVIDDRIKFTDAALKAGADEVICDSFKNALKNIEGNKYTFFIIVTRGHRYDQLCLEKIIKKENAYIGMIGSSIRVKKVFEHLETKGIDKGKIERVHAPIGLNIGAETPEEIAISIISELIQVKNKEACGIINNGYPTDILKGILSNTDTKKALVTIVFRRGSAPREVGTKMLVMKDGTTIGTIGGGCVEARIISAALLAIDNQDCRLINVNMTGEEAEEEGMVCGGIVQVFIEPIQ